MKILHLDSSITGEHSVTRRLSQKVVERILAQQPQAQVTYHDLVEQPYSHMQLADLTSDNPTLKALKESDVVVMGAPMYNLSIPTQLKAWFDRVVLAGETFRYTEKGPEGLLPSKKVIVVGGQGGVYGQNHQSDYVQTVLRFMGIEPLVIQAQGVNMGEDLKNQALEQALQAVDTQVPAYLSGD